MALVKVTVKCPHCKVDHEEYDQNKFDDREKYLAYWNLPFEGEEADKAWQAKLEMTPKEAPTGISLWQTAHGYLAVLSTVRI
jgi:protein-disulfide isomerase